MTITNEMEMLASSWKELAFKESEEKQLLINLMIEHYNDPCSVVIKKYLSRKEIKNEA